MKTVFQSKKVTQRGFTLIIAVLVAGIVLSIGLAILNITLKEFVLSNIARESQIAFSAADTGIECALYWDGTGRNRFAVTADPSTVSCVGGNVKEDIDGGSALVGGNDYGTASTFWLQWGSPEICAQVEVTKFDTNTLAECPADAVCTRIVSRGYNDCNLDRLRTVERALRVRY